MIKMRSDFGIRGFWFSVNGMKDMETEVDTETNFDTDTI